MEWVSKILDYFTLPVLLLTIGIASGFVLLSPSNWVETLGLTTIRDTYRGWIGLAFILSLALVLATLSWNVLQWAGPQLAKRLRRKHQYAMDEVSDVLWRWRLVPTDREYPSVCELKAHCHGCDREMPLYEGEVHEGVYHTRVSCGPCSVQRAWGCEAEDVEGDIKREIQRLYRTGDWKNAAERITKLKASISAPPVPAETSRKGPARP